MKTNQHNFSIILGLILITGLFSLHNTGYLGDANSDSYDQHMIFDDLKTSGTYKNITIDNLPGSSNNWAWAENQVWCSGSGTLLDPYIIEGHILNMSKSIDGVKISNSHNKHFIIRNCTFKWDGVTNSIYMTGIYLLNSTDGLMEDNLIYHLGYGIVLEDCENINIIGNTIYDHGYGIYLENSNLNTIVGNTANNNTSGIYLYFSDNNTVSGNTVNYNNDGLYLEESDDNTVSGNVANENTQNGIYSYFCDYNNITGNTANNNVIGINLDDSNKNTVLGNNVNKNGNSGINLVANFNTISRNNIDDNPDGIFIYVGLNNTIIGNTIHNNVRGIHIDEDSDYNEFTENIVRNNTIGINIGTLNDNNIVYKNFFLNNGMHASDSGTANKWNSSVIGNYWDNHTGPDVNPQDGIVDDPYAFIGGSVGSIDYLPIAEDGAPQIEIISPSAGSRFGSTSPSFNVEVIDVSLFEMWYTIDGGLNNYTFTENGIINQSAWEALSDGSVTITFYAIDIPGNEASEEVTIIKDVSPRGLDPGVIAVIVIVSVIGGVALLGVILVMLEKKGKISLEKIKKLIFRRK